MLFPRVDVKTLTTLSAFADAQSSTRSLLLVNLQIARVMIEVFTLQGEPTNERFDYGISFFL